MSQNWLKPDWDPGLCISQIPIKHFHNNGIRALFIDVDKTLLHGKNTEVHSSVIAWIKEAKKDLLLHLVSNNPSKIRIGTVANQLELTYTFRASKPRRYALKKVQENIKLRPNQIAIIGDRLFTDVLAGNRLGLFTVLVKPIGPDGNTCRNDRVQRLEKKVSRIIEVIQK